MICLFHSNQRVFVLKRSAVLQSQCANADQSGYARQKEPLPRQADYVRRSWNSCRGERLFAREEDFLASRF